MAVEPHIEAAYGAQSAARPDERLIAELAGAQHGVVARRQLLDAGFGPRAIGRRVDNGRLHPIHRGVYAVGHRVVTVRGRWMAAVLACGPSAVLSHRSAAALWDLRAYSGRHEVIAAGRSRGRSGLQLREISLPADEITTRDGIPVTTVARTLLDLAMVLDRGRLAHAVGEAEKRLLADSPSLPVLIERHRGARGLANLRALLASRRIGFDVPKSELEIEFQAFLKARGLPSPEVNAWIDVGGRMFEIDCLWREQRLAVELDSREHHTDRIAFDRDRDRARDSALLALGIRTLRVTARRLATDADQLEFELRAAASARAFGR